MGPVGVSPQLSALQAGQPAARAASEPGRQPAQEGQPPSARDRGGAASPQEPPTPPLAPLRARRRGGTSLLFHGYGSKRSLLQRFARFVSAGGGRCIQVDGLSPGLTARQVLVYAAAADKSTRASLLRQHILAQSSPHQVAS